MTDEIKRSAEALIAERRKAYEECVRILQIKLWLAITNEIRRRMEGVC